MKLHLSGLTKQWHGDTSWAVLCDLQGQSFMQMMTQVPNGAKVCLVLSWRSDAPAAVNQTNKHPPSAAYRNEDFWQICPSLKNQKLDIKRMLKEIGICFIYFLEVVIYKGKVDHLLCLWNIEYWGEELRELIYYMIFYFIFWVVLWDVKFSPDPLVWSVFIINRVLRICNFVFFFFSVDFDTFNASKVGVDVRSMQSFTCMLDTTVGVQRMRRTLGCEKVTRRSRLLSDCDSNVADGLTHLGAVGAHGTERSCTWGTAQTTSQSSVTWAFSRCRQQKRTGMWVAIGKTKWGLTAFGWGGRCPACLCVSVLFCSHRPQSVGRDELTNKIPFNLSLMCWWSVFSFFLAGNHRRASMNVSGFGSAFPHRSKDA